MIRSPFIRRFPLLTAFILSGMFSSLAAGDKPTALFLLDAEPNIALSSMGRIFSTLGPEDAFSRPWALSWTVNPGVTFAQWPGYMDDAKFSYAAVALPYTSWGTFGLNYLSYATGNETFEELDGTSRCVQLENDSLTGLGYGLDIGDSLFLGLSAKQLTGTLAGTYTGRATLFDAGLWYVSPGDLHSVGFSVTNYSQGITYYATKEPVAGTAKIGYTVKLKPRSGHWLIAGAAFERTLQEYTQTVSAGVAYYPGLSYLALRCGLRSTTFETRTSAGIGVEYAGVTVNAGYEQISGSRDAASSPVRLSVTWLFGPRSEYATAAALMARGKRERALSTWERIHADEPDFAAAQEAMMQNRRPPKFEVTTRLKDQTGDGMLSGAENGSIVVTVANRSDKTLSNIRIELVPLEPQKIDEVVAIDQRRLYQIVDYLDEGQTISVHVPVKAKFSVDGRMLLFNVRVIEGKKMEEFTVPFILKTKGLDAAPSQGAPTP